MTDRLKVQSGFRWDFDELETFDNKTIDEAIEELLKLKQRVLKSNYDPHHDYRFSVHYGYENTNITLVGYRDESDEEYNVRVEKLRKIEEKKQQKSELKKQKARDTLYNKEQDELAEYNRLKAKFGE